MIRAVLFDAGHTLTEPIGGRWLPGPRFFRRLRAANLPLAVITDAWPSVEAKFRVLGLRDYFAAFVISSRQGCVKPDPRMFGPALRAVGVPARESLSIDDRPDLVEDARAQGFRGLVMDRAGALPRREGVIRRLDELFAYLG